ncbi:MAG: hypothetical protein E5Y63_13105 [Mesorhizobium sp.]|nr:MAG: hypothetical protein EOR04_06435 [Mesorhizobium sp.]TIM30100.1 MAG: hypothetical protein E5Y63_13105 [Mesorhizobium sp.]
MSSQRCFDHYHDIVKTSCPLRRKPDASNRPVICLCWQLHRIDPKIGIDFRKVRCVDLKC